MFEHLIGIIFLGLGLVSNLFGNVKGDTVTIASASGSAQNLHAIYRTQRAAFERQVTGARSSANTTHQAERSAFTQKLATISNAQKKATVTAVDTLFGQINTSKTNAMVKQLTTMSEILEKIVLQAQNAKAKGVNTSSVDSAVTNAQSAINAAQTTIATQAGRQYIITIGTESTLKTSVTTTKNTLLGDLESASEQVANARALVKIAIQALQQLGGGHG